MNTRIVCLFFNVVMISCGIAFAAPRSHWRSDISVNIEPKAAGKHKVTVRHDETKIWLDNNGTTDYFVQIDGLQYAPMSHYKATKNGKPLRDTIHSQPIVIENDLFSADSKRNTFIFPGKPKAGDIYRIKWSSTYDEIAVAPIIVIPNEDSISEVTLTINHHPNVTVIPHMAFPFDSIPIAKEIGNARKEMYRFAGQSHQPTLPLFQFNDALAYIALEIRVSEKLKSTTSPQALTNWFTDLNPRIPTDDELTAFPLRDSVTALLDKESQLRALYNWIQTNIRYMPDFPARHDYKVASPSSVLTRGYGDCKDRAYLICALAHSFGIPVHPAIVSTTPPLPFDVIHLQRYDHIMCYYEDSLQNHFFDMTAPYHPFEDYPGSIVGHLAVILDKENPRMLPIPLNDTLPELSVELDGHIDSLSSVRVLLTLRGDILAEYRRAQLNRFYMASDERINQIIYKEFPQVPLRSYALVKESSREITIGALADINQWVITTQAKRYLPHALFVVVTSEALERANDTLPIHYEASINRQAHITLRGITGVAADSTLFGNPGIGYFAAWLRQSDSTTATASFHVTRRQKMVAQNEKEAHLDFCREYFAEKKRLFLLTSSEE